MKKNLLYSVMGIVLNTLFPILIFPYISRVLGAGGLGTYNFYNMAISYLALFSSFGIAIYGVREIGKYKDDLVKRSRTAVELVALNLLNALICSLIVILVAVFTHYRSDADIILILGIVLLTNALGAEWFFVAIEYQGYILVRSFLIKLLSLIVIFLFVKSPDDLLLYVIIVVIGLALPSLINFVYLFKHIKFPLLSEIQLSKHLKPLLLIFIVEISVRYFGMGDVVLLGSMDSKISVGYYTLALNIFMIVSSFIRVSAVTLLSRGALYLEQKNEDKFYLLIRSTVDFIFFMGVPCSLGLYLWADYIVRLLGGIDFNPSVLVLQYFASLILLSSLINMLVFQLLYPLNRVRTIIISFIGGIVINVGLNMFLIPVFSYIGTIYAAVISQLVICALLIIIDIKLVKKMIFSKNLLKYLIPAVLLIFSGMLLKSYFGKQLIILQIGVSCALYTLCLFLQKENILMNYVLLPLRRNEKKS